MNPPDDKPPNPLDNPHPVEGSADNPILIHPKKNSPLLNLVALGTAVGVDVPGILGSMRPTPEQAAKYARRGAADYYKAPDNTPITCPGCRRTLKRKNAVKNALEVWVCKNCL